MNFVHIADVHFGNSFSSLQGNNNFIRKRQLAQINAFEKIIAYIKNNNIEHLFISGDFFDYDESNTAYLKNILEFCNKKFDEIPNTQIWISPGNHDPYIKNSPYQIFDWSNNVHIFKNKIECYQLNDVDIYGYGFENFFVKNTNIDNIVLQNKNKINILVTHADLDASQTNDKYFNPLSSKKLMNIGFNYIALGHIHKSNFSKDSNIIYPGSTIALSFKNISESHGFVTGEITKDKYKIDFIPLDSDFYNELVVDTSYFVDKDELINEINNLYTNSESVCQIKLKGKCNFFIDTNQILKYINNENILKVIDDTGYAYDLNEISQENNLRGYFVKEMLQRLEIATEEEKPKIQKALEIGLDLF